MTLFHEWEERVVRRDKTTADKGHPHPLAVTQFICLSCGEAQPIGTVPMPWWADMANTSICKGQAKGR